MVISGSRVSDERKELDIVMTELAAYCAANDVCIIAVNHLNRDIAKTLNQLRGKRMSHSGFQLVKRVCAVVQVLKQLAWEF